MKTVMTADELPSHALRQSKFWLIAADLTKICEDREKNAPDNFSFSYLLGV